MILHCANTILHDAMLRARAPACRVSVWGVSPDMLTRWTTQVSLPKKCKGNMTTPPPAGLGFEPARGRSSEEVRGGAWHRCLRMGDGEAARGRGRPRMECGVYANRCRVNMAHVRKSRPDSGLRIWPWLPGRSPSTLFRCFLFARQQMPERQECLKTNRSTGG